MRNIQSCTYQNTNLFVLIDENTEDETATVSYFVNGYEVVDIDKIKPDFKALLDAMLTSYCTDYKLTIK